MNHARPRFLALVVLGILAATVAAVLALRAGSDGRDPGEPLAQEAAQDAMLTAADVGEDYVPGDDEATSYANQAPGCLAAVRRLMQDAGATVRVVRTFVGPPSQPASVVSTQVASFASVVAAEGALAAFQDEVVGCTSVTPGKARNGYRFKVTTEVGVRTSDIDEQVRVRAIGSLATANGQGLPLGMWISVARVANHVSIVRLIEVPKAGGAAAEASASARMDGFATVAASRLTKAS